ncbi:GSCFA domain-containing protein [Rhodovibrionaceae bacterium A322]
MAENPYHLLPPKAFWRTAVAEAKDPVPEGLFTPKWPIAKDQKIATAGSCFAQHIGKYLFYQGFTVLDKEPAPTGLHPDDHADFGYGIYSARYGNIYTVRGLLHLAQEAFGRRPQQQSALEKAGRFYDPVRQTIEPEGLPSPELVQIHRERHLSRVREMFLEAEVLIFTLGLTEAWLDRKSGSVFSICPGIVAGNYEPEEHLFKNFRYREIYEDFLALMSLLEEEREGQKLRYLLTVSPVPLTATAQDRHVLVSTIHSKSVLRAVAGDLAAEFEDVDYFPSYEIITSPWSGANFYEANKRSVAKQGVYSALNTFNAAYGDEEPADETPDPAEKTDAQAAELEEKLLEEDLRMRVVCDEELLKALGE